MFEIYPLHVATLKQVDKSVLTSLKDAGEKIDLNCIAWVIRSNKAVYVVDPGPGHDVMRAKNIHHREMSLEGCTDLLRGLKNLNIMPLDVNAIINTHLHWDHCIANDSLLGIPVIENYECCHPVRLYVNLFDWYQSYEKVKRMNVEVLPSHDPLLMSRKVY